METIIGSKLSRLPVDELHKIGDLFYFYYALHTLYRTNKGALYMCNWMERDDVYSRWLLFKVSPEAILNYIDNKISDLELLQNVTTPFICFDVDEHQTEHNIVACSFNDIPASYLPKASAVFYEENAPDIKAIRDYLNSYMSKIRPLLEVSY